MQYSLDIRFIKQCLDVISLRNKKINEIYNQFYKGSVYSPPVLERVIANIKTENFLTANTVVEICIIAYYIMSFDKHEVSGIKDKIIKFKSSSTFAQILTTLPSVQVEIAKNGINYVLINELKSEVYVALCKQISYANKIGPDIMIAHYIMYCDSKVRIRLNQYQKVEAKVPIEDSYLAHIYKGFVTASALGLDSFNLLRDRDFSTSDNEESDGYHSPTEDYIPEEDYEFFKPEQILKSINSVDKYFRKRAANNIQVNTESSEKFSILDWWKDKLYKTFENYSSRQFIPSSYYPSSILLDRIYEIRSEIKPDNIYTYVENILQYIDFQKNKTLIYLTNLSVKTVTSKEPILSTPFYNKFINSFELINYQAFIESNRMRVYKEESIKECYRFLVELLECFKALEDLNSILLKNNLYVFEIGDLHQHFNKLPGFNSIKVLEKNIWKMEALASVESFIYSSFSPLSLELESYLPAIINTEMYNMGHGFPIEKLKGTIVRLSEKFIKSGIVSLLLDSLFRYEITFNNQNLTYNKLTTTKSVGTLIDNLFEAKISDNFWNIDSIESVLAAFNLNDLDHIIEIVKPLFPDLEDREIILTEIISMNGTSQYALNNNLLVAGLFFILNTAFNLNEYCNSYSEEELFNQIYRENLSGKDRSPFEQLFLEVFNLITMKTDNVTLVQSLGLSGLLFKDYYIKEKLVTEVNYKSTSYYNYISGYNPFTQNGTLTKYIPTTTFSITNGEVDKTLVLKTPLFRNLGSGLSKYPEGGTSLKEFLKEFLSTNNVKNSDDLVKFILEKKTEAFMLKDILIRFFSEFREPYNSTTLSKAVGDITSLVNNNTWIYSASILPTFNSSLRKNIKKIRENILLQFSEELKVLDSIHTEYLVSKDLNFHVPTNEGQRVFKENIGLIKLSVNEEIISEEAINTINFLIHDREEQLGFLYNEGTKNLMYIKENNSFLYCHGLGYTVKVEIKKKGLAHVTCNKGIKQFVRKGLLSL